MEFQEEELIKSTTKCNSFKNSKRPQENYKAKGQNKIKLIINSRNFHSFI